MIKFEDEVIIVAKLKVIDWIHEHNFSYCELFNPVLISLDSKQISFILLPYFLTFLNVYIIFIVLFSKDFRIVLILF